jgi:hypothetical protein
MFAAMKESRMIVPDPYPDGRLRLPNGMPIPSLASIIASLDPTQFTLGHPIWKTALRGERSDQD